MILFLTLDYSKAHKPSYHMCRNTQMAPRDLGGCEEPFQYFWISDSNLWLQDQGDIFRLCKVSSHSVRFINSGFRGCVGL